MGRIKVSQIVFARVEGAVRECREWLFQGPTCWDDVETLIREIRWSAPRGGGYDKCRVEITFADGYTYATRYDMQHPDAGSCMLVEHVRREWLFNARRWCPGHMAKDRHDAFLAACGVNSALWGTRCDAYAVPGMEPPNARTLQWIPTVRGGVS